MTSSISSADVSSAKPGDHRRRRDDLALLTFVLVFVLCNSAIVYLGVHYNVLLFFIGALAALLLTGYVAFLFIFRTVKLRLFRSPLLLAATAILAGQVMIYRAAFYVIDLSRLYANISFYTTAVEASGASPRFVTFNWGESGFAGSSGWYYLPFDEIGHAANPPPGTASTANALTPGPNCAASVSHLSGHFYSLAINC